LFIILLTVNAADGAGGLRAPANEVNGGEQAEKNDDKQSVDDVQPDGAIKQADGE